MNRKGVLFAFMVFMIVMVVLSLGMTVRNGRLKLEGSMTDTTAFESVSGKFGNIINDVVAYDKNGLARDVQTRLMPFNYVVDGNRVRVTQELPIKKSVFDNAFDILNAYDIFISDTNSQTTYDLMEVDANAPRNANWGGNVNSLQFMAEPQCLKFVFVDENTTAFKGGVMGEGCAASFTSALLKRYDLNIAIKRADQDYNSVICDFSGSGCPNEAFNPASSNPYFEMVIDDTNCTNCRLSYAQKHVRGHYVPTYNNKVTISCVGAACKTTDPIIAVINRDMNVQNRGVAVDSTIASTLLGAITRFNFMDFNFSVNRRDFNAFMTNVG